MTCRSRRWLIVLAGLGLLGATLRAAAQEPTADTLPDPKPLGEPAPPPYVLPPPGWPTVVYQCPDPLLDRPDAPQPGYYVNVEANPLWVHFRNQLSAPLLNPVTGMTDTVQFPGNRLNPTLSPRVELGYRFPDNWGGCQLGLTSITTQGHDTVFTGLQPQDGFSSDSVQGFASQSGRLSTNLIDLTYVSQEYIIGPHWNFRAGVGLRYLASFIDSRVQFLSPSTAPGSVLAQGENNRNNAIGVWGFIDVERGLFGVPGLAVFGRGEATDTYSRIRQLYSEQIVNAAGTGIVLAETQFPSSVGLSILRGVAGLSYTVPQWNYARFMVGYQYGSFFQIGRITNINNGIPDTRGQLNIQGVLLRAEIHF